jgi:hypothetical protein
LKKLLFIVVIGLGVFQHFSNSSMAYEPVINAPIKVIKIPQPKVKYICDGRKHCSQMGSYNEAKFFLKHCPGTKMDGDRDGIPCERQFNQ